MAEEHPFAQRIGANKPVGPTVLIVDRNETVRQNLSTYLRAWNFLTVAFASTEEAVQYLTTSHINSSSKERPLCALVDFKENWTALDSIRKICEVVVLTPAMATRTTFPGITIKKPINFRQLAAVLSHQLTLSNATQSTTSSSTSQPTAKKAASSGNGSECRILVAEDNHMNQIVVKKMLQALGYNQVDIVENGKEAVNAAAKHHYSIILMDCMVRIYELWQTAFLFFMLVCESMLTILSTDARDGWNRSYDDHTANATH